MAKERFADRRLHQLARRHEPGLRLGPWEICQFWQKPALERAADKARREDSGSRMEMIEGLLLDGVHGERGDAAIEGNAPRGRHG